MALLQKYVDARKTAEADKQRLSQQMSTEQQKAKAEQDRLSQQLSRSRRSRRRSWRCAWPTPSTPCSTPRESTAPRATAGQGRGGPQAERLRGRPGRAEAAKKSADDAAVTAKPLYEKAEEASQNKARNEALVRDAPAIPGVKVRIDPRGDLQRLVIVVPELFNKREPNIAPGHEMRARRRRQAPEEVSQLPRSGGRLHRQQRQVDASSSPSPRPARRRSTRRWPSAASRPSA